jgi:signal transduction histidine kinase
MVISCDTRTSSLGKTLKVTQSVVRKSLHAMIEWIGNGRPDKYLVKVGILVVAYYASAKLGDFMTFINLFEHNEYPPYWPPSGIALGFVLVFGRSMWPGIVIATLILMPDNYYLVGEGISHWKTTGFVAAGFAIGRCIEPIVGMYLLRRVCPGGVDAFGTPSIALRFVLVTMVISPIGSCFAVTAIQMVTHDPGSVYITRSIAWYIDNVVGILLFTPLVIAVFLSINFGISASSVKTTLTIILLSALYVFYLPEIKSLEINSLFIDSLPFLLIPVLLWIAFQYHLLVPSVAVIIVSIVAIFFTTLGIGPFVMPGNWQYSVWLLQSFLVVASVSSLLYYSASAERRRNEQKLAEQARELQFTNQTLLSTMEHLREARDKAEQSDRLKSSFLTNISHEIRTPMNAIMGFSELMERPNFSESKRQEFSRLIHERSRDLLTIVNDILDISKLESGHVSSVPVTGDMNEFLNRLILNFRAETHLLKSKEISVRLNNQLSMKAGNVVADFAKLTQVLSNLLSNAAKFTQKGFILLTCSVENEKELVFAVEDSGLGIHADKLDVIFKPFHQANETIHQHYGGSGLGLAICNGLVQLMGGRIWVNSTPGRGSIFYFTIPYCPAEPKPGGAQC